jgi:hypothetical protein
MAGFPIETFGNDKLFLRWRFHSTNIHSTNGLSTNILLTNGPGLSFPHALIGNPAKHLIHWIFTFYLRQSAMSN